MEIKIMNEYENKVIGRKEITFEINYTQNPPSRLQAKNELAKQIKVEPNLVVIKKMANVFGLRKMICNANVYPDEKILTKFEPKYIIKRLKKAEEKGGAQQETPKQEETKPEPKEEKKEGEQ